MNKELQKRVSNRLRFFRKRAKMTQIDLEGLSGVPRSSISKIELGVNKKMTVDQLMGFCRALGVTPNDFLCLMQKGVKPDTKELPPMSDILKDL